MDDRRASLARSLGTCASWERPGGGQGLARNLKQEKRKESRGLTSLTCTKVLKTVLKSPV